jgi:hypothetical protein
MNAIDGVISELAKIRNALGQEASEPWRRPRRFRSTATTESEQVSSDPTFDADRWELNDPDLWEEEKENARRSVEGQDASGAGIEALAWYVSFHDDQQRWGIYIPLSSLALMDELYLNQLPMDRDRRLHLAWSVLLLHEQMHFTVDIACAWFELMLRAPIRREFMARFKVEPPFKQFEKSETYLEIEETIANAHMLRQLRNTQSRQIMRTVESFVEKQPSGYREGLEATGDAAFAAAEAETLRCYFSIWAIEHRLDLGNRELDISRLLPREDDSVHGECPVYAIQDLENVGVKQGSIRLIQCISEVVETENFASQLQRQDPSVQRDWDRRKEQIKSRLPSPPRFEKLRNWKPPTWSLRLRDGHRVHLQPPDSKTAAWRAVAIGSHKEMGHG